MRFSLLVVGLVALAAACAEGQPPRPVVILVHGRGHMDDDSASLRRAWKSHLDSALNGVGMAPLRADDVRLAWYADVLDPSLDTGCPIARSSDDTGGFDTFARDFLGSLASALPRNESRGARMLLGDMLYAVDASRRCGAQRRVGAAIDAALAEHRPVIVVAYSLGAMVSYEHLSARKAGKSRPADVRLITLGSPLGNPNIRALLGQSSHSLRLPGNVSSWENIYDPDDAFAAPLELKATGVSDRTVESASGYDPHYVDRYLRDRATGAALARALCVNPDPAIRESCRTR